MYTAQISRVNGNHGGHVEDGGEREIVKFESDDLHPCGLTRSPGLSPHPLRTASVHLPLTTYAGAAVEHTSDCRPSVLCSAAWCLYAGARCAIPRVPLAIVRADFEVEASCSLLSVLAILSGVAAIHTYPALAVLGMHAPLVFSRLASCRRDETQHVLVSRVVSDEARTSRLTTCIRDGENSRGMTVYV